MTLTISRTTLTRLALLIAVAMAVGAVAIGVPQLSPAAGPVKASAFVPAALNGFLSAKGSKSGPIQGSVTQKGRENSIMVIAFSWELKTPIDPASGDATGKRQHKPFTFTKEQDKSTPVLLTALATNEVLTEAVFRFWSPSPTTGTEVQDMTYTFKNAHIVGIAIEMANIRDPALMKYAPYERVSLTYDAVDVVWTQGGITFQDSWAL
jgi:type VI secretion system secreted protein Hcp